MILGLIYSEKRKASLFCFWFFLIFNWWIIALQCCVGLCQTTMQISYVYIFIYVHIYVYSPLLSLPLYPLETSIPNWRNDPTAESIPFPMGHILKRCKNFQSRAFYMISEYRLEPQLREPTPHHNSSSLSSL